MFTEQLLEFNHITIFIRLVLSMFLGALIGADRSRKGSPAGLKTHSLVCIGSTLIMLTSEYCFVRFGIGDITRLPAQVVSGIGFLGAGTILVTGKDRIKGLTSAASIWFSASIGLAVGIGFYEGAIIAAVMEFVVLKLLSRTSFLQARRTDVDLYIEFNHDFDLGKLLEVMKQWDMDIINVDHEIFNGFKVKDDVSSILIAAQHRGKKKIPEALMALQQVQGVLKVQEY